MTEKEPLAKRLYDASENKALSIGEAWNLLAEAAEVVALLTTENKTLFDEAERAWQLIEEVQRRLLIVNNAMRGFTRVVGGNKHFGRQANVTDRDGPHGLVDERTHDRRT